MSMMAEKPHLSQQQGRTVFVRYLPPSEEVTRHDLEDFFSNVGPIKKCSVISSSSADDEGSSTTKRNKNNGKSGGYGFVKFVAAEDAVLAAEQCHNANLQVHGKTYKLKVELATTSTTTQPQPQTHNSRNDNNTLTVDNTTTLHQPDSKDLSSSSHHHHDNKEEQLSKLKRSCRVIVRNVSFYAKEKDICKCMETHFGTVVQVDLPRVPATTSTTSGSGGKASGHRGFAFVTFANSAAAHKATQPRDEPILIKKRPVAIDFSVNKTVHQHQKQQQQQLQKKEKIHHEESESSDSEESGDDEEENSKLQDSDEDQSGDEGNGTDDSEKDEEEEDGSVEDGSESTSSADQDESASESDEDKRNDDVRQNQSETATSSQEQAPENDEAIQEKRTLFVRNLPFDVTRHDLFELFSPHGYISGIYLVKDKVTGIAKGTAFVSFEKADSASTALEAAGGGAAFVTQRDGLTSSSSITTGANGLHLRGRRLWVDLAVDKQTASSLTADKQSEKSHGKDRRNLYLKMEGRVANRADGGGTDNGAWESLPESDQLKRQRAFADKNTKLRSPLFFINPFRLSVRNLAKHVDEVMLKKLCVAATKRGLDARLVSREDLVAHWRASGEMSTRDILQHIQEVKEQNENGSLIPQFDEKNVKRCIPSVFIDRDFTTNKKEKAPSRGFGFVDFTHHAHALACLRELNNNPYYSAEYATGGKRAAEVKRLKKRKKGESPKGEFIGEDGRVLLPRLIVEFAVENKAKAKQQAEHRARQQANTEKQREVRRQKILSGELPPKKKKGRGARQRERRRQEREAAERGEGNLEAKAVSVPITEQPRVSKETRTNDATQSKPKGVKPPKKKRKIDKEEENFQSLVEKYRSTFGENVVDSKETREFLKSQSKKRWFED